MILVLFLSFVSAVFMMNLARNAYAAENLNLTIKNGYSFDVIVKIDTLGNFYVESQKDVVVYVSFAGRYEYEAFNMNQVLVATTNITLLSGVDYTLQLGSTQPGNVQPSNPNINYDTLVSVGIPAAASVSIALIPIIAIKRGKSSE